MEVATGRWVERRRNLPLDRLEPPPPRIEPRHLPEQCLGIGVVRFGEQFFGRPKLDDSPQIHDRHAIGQVLDDTQIMADEQIGKSKLLAQLHEQVEDLSLDRDIERRHRFVAHDEVGFHRERPGDDEALALASLAELLHRRRDTEARARRSADPHSPWHQTSGWRLNAETQVRLSFRDGEREVAVMVHYRPDGFAFDLPGGRAEARGTLGPDGVLLAELDGRRVTGSIVRHQGDIVVLLPGGIHRLRLVDPLRAAAEEEAGPGRLTAPMPGKVIQVHVSPGEEVERGAPLMVIEAMKMEHAISAPADGKIARVLYAAGDLVEEGAELIAFETEE